jgi:phosphoserine phosphatase
MTQDESGSLGGPDEQEEPDNGWVITVIGRTEVEPALGRALEIVKEQGLELDYFKALSAIREGFLIASEGAYACAEIHAYGTVEEEARWRAEYRELAEDYSVDAVLQRETDFERAKRLVVFDMDSTLIQGETIDELAKMAGVGEQVAAITAAAMRGELDFQGSFRRRMALLKGLPQVRVLEVLERIPVMEGAERLFRTLKARGVKTAVLSGGFTFFGEHLQRRLGVDFVHANVLDVAVGLVTGEVRTRIVDGAAKAELLQEIAGREGISLEETVAVGDGANDLPMLRLAGLGVAFHAKPVVRAEAGAAMSYSGLDGLLYLLGIPDREWV